MSSVISSLQDWIHNLRIPTLALIGLLTVAGFYLGKLMRFIRLPSIVGFLIVGVLVGPSLLGAIDANLENSLSFITEIALGFVALSIGLELKVSTLKTLGSGIVLIILFESFLAFFAVTGFLYLLTRDLPLSLLFGAIAPASAPAGTVAIIQEFKASGKLTNALYAVVGFDDGLGIIIFGFAAAFARSIVGEAAGGTSDFWTVLLVPLKEVGLSFLVGGGISFFYVLLMRKLDNRRDLFILTFATVVLTIGVSSIFHLSIILTNLIVGSVVVNTQDSNTLQKIREGVGEVMPLLFILFFILAGSHLQLAVLPSLGLIGIVYIGARSAGLLGGAWLGAFAGRSDPKIRKYLGLGILSQAGVAIGLSLIVQQEFSSLSQWGADIGATVITTVTASSIIFELIGPVTCKIGLKKAGEIAG
jgi:Kef-type K+ transport system membrane component KefB